MDDVLEVAPAPLILLDEGLVESLSLDGYWDRVTDAVTATLANPLYLDIEDQGIATVFHDYQRRRGLSLDIQQAPWPDRFRLGLGTVLDWAKEGRLQLHRDSLTLRELKSIEGSTLGDKPEVKWPLTNSLRLLTAGFRKYAAAKPLTPGREFYGGHDGWMR